MSLFALALALAPPSVRRPEKARLAPDASLQRILVYAPVVEGLVTLDDGPARIAATPSYLRDGALAHPVSRIFPQIAAMGVTGPLPVPDPEEVMRRDADAVVVAEGLRGTLDAIGFPHVIEVAPALGYLRDKVRTGWHHLAVALGRSDRAEALLAAYDAELAEAQPPAMPQAAPLRVLVLIPIAGDWRIGGSRLYLNPLLEELGAENVAHALPLNSSADIEQVLALDPEVILIQGGPGAPAPATLFDDPRWRSVQAVRDRRVYLMPVRATFNAPLDEPAFIRWMRDVLFPGRAPEGTRALYEQAYARAFGRELDADDLRFALQWEANKGSAGYDRFAVPDER